MNQDGHCVGEPPGAKIARRWRFEAGEIERWFKRERNKRQHRR